MGFGSEWRVIVAVAENVVKRTRRASPRLSLPGGLAGSIGQSTGRHFPSCKQYQRRQYMLIHTTYDRVAFVLRFIKPWGHVAWRANLALIVAIDPCLFRFGYSGTMPPVERSQVARCSHPCPKSDGSHCGLHVTHTLARRFARMSHALGALV